jgi:hypothetical protein
VGMIRFLFIVELYGFSSRVGKECPIISLGVL